MNWWWANAPSRKLAGVSALVTRNLYGSWKLSEGAGSSTASEVVSRSLTLTSDSGTTAPAWVAGGLYFNGTTVQLSRPHETDQEALSTGVSFTVAYRLDTPTALGRLVLNHASNRGFFVQANTSGKVVQTGVGNGTSTSTQGIRNYTDTELGVLCVSISPSGVIKSNFNGTNLTEKTAVALTASTTAKLLIGYNFKGYIYYAALHTTELTDQERANQVAYAQSILTSKGVA